MHDGGYGLVCLHNDAHDYFVTPENIAGGDWLSRRIMSGPFTFSNARYTGHQRSIVHLIGMSAISADLRPAHPGQPAHAWQNRSEERAVDIAADLIARCQIAARPTIIATAGGLRVSIAHDHLPADAAPRWKALQREFQRELLAYGASVDPDITHMIEGGRVLVEGGRVRFEHLCDALLPLTRDECKRKRQRGEWTGEQTPEWLWWRRQAEIREWCRRCWPAGTPPQFQRRILRLLINAFGWSVASPNELQHEIRVVAREIAPGRARREIDEMTAGIAADRKLYKYSNDALRDYLLTGVGMAEADVYDRIVSERKARLGAKGGRAKGMVNAGKRARARAMAATMTQTAIAVELGVSQKTISNWLP
ncbi:MAG: hypothetical protein Q8K23_19080 [Sulfuritalea sp.]|nr:hypothetical protein [Sulfuritalea sp.]